MFKDLRAFLEELDKRGRLKVFKGCNLEWEVGTINEMVAERKGPALIFDEIEGYPKGFRIATNILHTELGCKLAFGIPEELSPLDVVRFWRDRWRDFSPMPPKTVDKGPILENVQREGDVKLSTIPVPKWHELDGGRYIGTGVVTITRDPDEGWVNLGTYRVMVHDENTLSFYASPGKHATLMREKYWRDGKPCPVVMCFGQAPLLFGISTMPLPWGISELDFAGYIYGEPVEVIEGEVTGLPIPSTCEIAIEGFSPPPDEESRPEGPFGEWTGYYASGRRAEPVVKVKRLYFRDDPILHGQPPIKPPVNTWYPYPLHTAPLLWDQLERNGMVGIKGVYVHGPGGRVIAVISIKQSYIGHAKQVLTLSASLLQGGACTGRYIVVVDDDIDPSNLEEVIWAVTTRCDPERYIDIIPGYLTSPLDPMLSPEKRERGDITTAKVLINACKPYHWKDSFPPVNRASEKLRRKVLERFPEIAEIR